MHLVSKFSLLTLQYGFIMKTFLSLMRLPESYFPEAPSLYFIQGLPTKPMYYTQRPQGKM